MILIFRIISLILILAGFLIWGMTPSNSSFYKQSGPIGAYTFSIGLVLIIISIPLGFVPALKNKTKMGKKTNNIILVITAMLALGILFVLTSIPGPGK